MKRPGEMRGVGEVRCLCCCGQRALTGDGDHRSGHFAPEDVTPEGQTDLLFEEMLKPARRKKDARSHLFERESQIPGRRDQVQYLCDSRVGTPRWRDSGAERFDEMTNQGSDIHALQGPLAESAK